MRSPPPAFYSERPRCQAKYGHLAIPGMKPLLTGLHGEHLIDIWLCGLASSETGVVARAPARDSSVCGQPKSTEKGLEKDIEHIP